MRRLVFLVIIILGIALVVWLVASLPEMGSEPELAGEPVTPADPAPVDTASINNDAKPRPAPVVPAAEAVIGPGAINGRAYAPDGNLAVGVLVKAEWHTDARGRDSITEEEALAVLPSGATETETDADGRFRLEGLPLGSYRMVARTEHAGAVALARLTQRVPEAQVDLVLSAGRPLGGIVVNEQDAPVAGAAVVPMANDGDELRSYEREVLTVATDGEGRFLFPVLSLETWTLYVVADGYAPKVTPPFPVGTDTARIVLDAGEPLLGRVIARADAQPLPKVVVTAQLDPLYVDPVRTRSGGDGTFTFAGLAPGRYVLDLEDPILVLEGGPQVVDIPRTTAALLELRAGRGGEIHGRLFDAASGEGIPDVFLYAMPVDHEGARRTSSATDSAGQFVIVGLSPGTYRLQPQVDAPGLPMQSRGIYTLEVPVAIDEITEGVEIPVHRGLTIRGQVVTADGTPAPNAFVMGKNDEGWYEQITSDTAGQFVLVNAEEGMELYFTAHTAGALSDRTGPFTVPAGGLEDVTITLSQPKDSVIAGWVVNPKGQPLRAKVTALSDANQKLISVPPMAYTDYDGAFVLTGVAPGNYALIVDAEGAGQKDLHTLRIDGNQHITGLRLVYPAGDLSISGRVTDTEGNPVRVYVEAGRQEDNGVFPSDSQHTRADGTYEIPNLEEGTYYLMVRRDGEMIEDRPNVPAGSTGVDFAVADQPRISGRVVNSQGTPVARFDIATVMIGRGAHFQPVFKPVSNGDGAFELTVQSGSYELLVRAEGYQMVRQGGFNLDPGEHIDGVVITLQAGDSTARGVVNDASGRPVAGAYIFASGLPPRPERVLDGSTIHSGSDGSFAVQVVPGEATEIGAYHPKAGSGAGRYDPNNPRQLVTIILQGAGTVTGTVRVGGAPAPHYFVQLTDSGGNRQQAPTNQDGLYAFEGISPGQVTVSVQSGPGNAFTQEAIVASGGVTEVDFDL